jgi:SAM-dependent methyltransferase
VLDVGTGDGSIANAIMLLRPDITIEGIDVLLRPSVLIPVRLFDGKRLPFADKTFDAVAFVDVLHHIDEPLPMLIEATRVARRWVIIKDHLREGMLARTRLRLMDWVGNYGHDVRLPCKYLRKREWQSLFASVGLESEHWMEQLDLYSPVLSWLFERRLHFIARMAVASGCPD